MCCQVTEELEKVKQEMDERGTSMTDGGKTAALLNFSLHKHKFCATLKHYVWLHYLRIYSAYWVIFFTCTSVTIVRLFSSTCEDQAGHTEASSGNESNGHSYRRR